MFQSKLNTQIQIMITSRKLRQDQKRWVLLVKMKNWYLIWVYRTSPHNVWNYFYLRFHLSVCISLTISWSLLAMSLLLCYCIYMTMTQEADSTGGQNSIRKVPIVIQSPDKRTAPIVTKICFQVWNFIVFYKPTKR